MDKQQANGRHFFYRSCHLSRRIGAAALALGVGALAGCGGGGGSSDDSFFGVTGPRANATGSADSLYTVCVNGTGLVDPNTAAGQEMARKLAARYQIVSGTAYTGTGFSCHSYYKTPSVVLSMADYQVMLLADVVVPTPTPTPTATPAPKPVTPALTPRACGESEGAGVNGLRLVGPTRYDGLSTVPSTQVSFNFDPGLVSYTNSTVSSSAVTGSLRTTLWAVSGVYTGSAGVPAVVMQREALNVGNSTSQLRNGLQVDPPLAAVSGTTPERGSYCLVVTLEHYADSCTSADKYCIVDWIQYPKAVQFE